MKFYNVFAIAGTGKSVTFVIKQYDDNHIENGSRGMYIRDSLEARRNGAIVNSLCSAQCNNESEAIQRLQSKIKAMQRL